MQKILFVVVALLFAQLTTAAAQPQQVNFDTGLTPGSILVDQTERKLYLALEGGQSLAYRVAVGRDGFRWSGTHKVSRKAEWPDWIPPKEMLARQKHLPRFMAGGPGNPLGAAALYIGNTLYRIHGSDSPSTIGMAVSSGCFRMTNKDVADLYKRVQIGATVVVR